MIHTILPEIIYLCYNNALSLHRFNIMITATELKSLAVQKEIYHFMAMVGLIEDTFNISTEDYQGKFQHKRDWLAKKGYSDNPKSEKQKKLQFTQYQDDPEGEKAAPVFCSFWHWSLDYILGEIDNGSVVSVNWKNALENAHALDKKNPGSNDWTITICQYGVEIFGERDYDILVEW